LIGLVDSNMACPIQSYYASSLIGTRPRPHSFSSSEERAERFWRHNDVIWQLVKLCFC